MASEAETAVDIIQVFDVVARVASLVAAHRADNGALATRGAPRENMAVISSALSLIRECASFDKTNYNCTSRHAPGAWHISNILSQNQKKPFLVLYALFPIERNVSIVTLLYSHGFEGKERGNTSTPEDGARG